MHTVNEFLLQELRRRDIGLATFWFPQDGATAHTAWQSMNTLRSVFEDCIISSYGEINWQGLSADMSACDFFRAATFKAKLSVTSGRVT
jgi:hypothetical protein